MHSWKRVASSRRALSQEWAARWYSKEALYRELGLSEGASRAEIKQAYHRRALQCHPDLHPNDGTEFRRITESYQRILNGGGGSQYRVAGPQSQSPEPVFFQRPAYLWWVSFMLGLVLFSYPAHMLVDNRSRMLRHREPSRFVEPSRDAVKRERIAAILFERQRKAKEQD